MQQPDVVPTHRPTATGVEMQRPYVALTCTRRPFHPSIRATLCVVCINLWCGSLWAGDRAALALERHAWLGVPLIAFGLLLLLAGWRLISWTTMLLSAGIVIGTTLVWCEPHLQPMWAWITALSCGVLGGALGWFAYPLLLAVQMCLFAGGATASALLAFVPTIPGLAYGLGAGVGVVAGIIGWKAAAFTAIFHTVLLGYCGVCAGMIFLCKPTGHGEHLVLAAVVALCTIPAGAFVQWRAQHREQYR
jgi:hypothetical protein